MPKKPKEPGLSEIFPWAATCERRGKEADSFAQMETEHWYTAYPTDDDGNWTRETPFPECASCGAGWDRGAR